MTGPSQLDRQPFGASPRRFAVLAYGVLCYLVFLAVFLYAIGFVGNLLVPKSIDSEPSADPFPSLLIDLALLACFAAPHSIMARAGFKAWWTRIVAQPCERSTYVLSSSLLLALLFWQWAPIPEVIWATDVRALQIAAQVVFWIGWGIVLWSTTLIDHFDLFGLRQVYFYFQGRPYQPPAFKVVALYRFVRHPIMLGFLLAFWATPRMTAGHLLFASTTTLYILAAIRLEERDLLRSLGSQYEAYRSTTGMLLPWRKPRKPID